MPSSSHTRDCQHRALGRVQQGFVPLLRSSSWQEVGSPRLQLCSIPSGLLTLLLKSAIYLPIRNGDFPYSYVNVYQWGKLQEDREPAHFSSTILHPYDRNDQRCRIGWLIRMVPALGSSGYCPPTWILTHTHITLWLFNWPIYN